MANVSASKRVQGRDPRHRFPPATRCAPDAAPRRVAFCRRKPQATDSVGIARGGKKLRLSFLAEFWAFLRVRKKYWLLPAVLTMLLFGGLVAITQTSAVAPMIYTIF